MLERLRLILAIALARSVSAAVRLSGRGAASVFPGSLARKLQPRTLELLAKQVRKGIVLVAGTNGKTTTSLLLRAMLEGAGYRTIHNATGANLENGLATALIDAADWTGQIHQDVAILEVDENVLPKVLPKIRPRSLLALNLFRDQLDRYGEVDTIARRWLDAIAVTPGTAVVLNADDPTLSHFGQELLERWGGDLSRVRYFGLNEPDRYLSAIPHAVDSIYCPRCGQSLQYAGVYLSHLGDFHCTNCGFEKSPPHRASADWPQILVGLYNKYNTLAAVETADLFGVDELTAREAIATFKAAFGRSEELTVSGTPIRILLSKNPVGTNETLRTVVELTAERPHPPTVLLALNDRAPDGKDVSWIWDTDTEGLARSGATLVVTGDRAYDMALRLTYSHTESAIANPVAVETDLKAAINRAIAATPPGETLYILPTYSAMLEVREILTGRAIS